MRSLPTANQLGGRATGSLFFTVFGSMWLLLALYTRQTLNLSSALGVLLGALALVWNAAHLMGRARQFRSVPADPAQGRAFAWINAIQWIAAAAVAILFAKQHIDAYVLNAITAIVGLHMFPLARLFRYPLHHGTGAALVVWSVASAFMAPAEQLQGVCALGTGLILWVSAAVTLVVAFQSMRRPARQLA